MRRTTYLREATGAARDTGHYNSRSTAKCRSASNARRCSLIVSRIKAIPAEASRSEKWWRILSSCEARVLRHASCTQYSHLALAYIPAVDSRRVTCLTSRPFGVRAKAEDDECDQGVAETLAIGPAPSLLPWSLYQHCYAGFKWNMQ
jgi:hypothetical protein